MADSDGGRTGGVYDDKEEGIVFTANKTFIAWATGNQVVVRRLDNDAPSKVVVDLALAPTTRPILAFSDLLQNHLVVGHCGKTSIYDVETGTRRITITGVGRFVTSVAWSSHDPEVVATGLTDGSICTWSLEKPSRPLQRLISTHGVCDSLHFSPTHSNIFASGHVSAMAIWSLRYPSGPLKVVTEMPRFDKLLWNPSCPGLILCSAPTHGVCMFDLLDVLDDETGRYLTRSESGMTDISEDWSPLPDINFGKDHALRQSIPCDPADVCWYNGNNLGILLNDGQHVCMFEQMHGVELLSEASTIHFQEKSGLLRIQTTRDGEVKVVVESITHSQSYELANDSIEERSGVIEVHPVDTTNRDSRRVSENSLSEDVDARYSESCRDMTPIQLSRTSHARQSAVEARITTAENDHLHDTGSFMGREQHEHNLTSSKVKSFGKLLHPFDKPPGITRVHSESNLTTGSTSATLVQRNKEAAFETPENQDSVASIATQASQESDSDDESFGHGMRGSATFMPEGVNVPIPKACGAIFATNGQLLTFMPPRPALPRLPQNTTKDITSVSKRSRLSISHLFPTFGNLLFSSTFSEASSTSNDSEDEAAEKHRSNALQSRHTAFSDAIWSNKISPVKTVLDAEAPPPTLLLQIHRVGTTTPYPHEKTMVYQIFAMKDQSVVDVAVSNSKLAEQHGRPDAALTWHLLSLILMGYSSPPAMAFETEEIFTSFAVRNDGLSSGPELALAVHQFANTWDEHPFGTPWLILQLFKWAEQHADIQLLSYTSAVLLAADQALASERARASKEADETSDRMQTGRNFRTHQSNLLRNDNLPPILRAQSSSSPASEFSPNKAFRSSRASSRNVSQPPTPFLESSVSTPPLILPGFARQSTRTSLSGTASPEHHRGSFSAAAKYYAQSITDKFSAYGSSPPFRRLGTSPNAELSSSLPNNNASGSWSKSVSFASTNEKTRESQLSSSLTVSQDGYDSDKTIEDSSTPHTPKGDLNDIYFETKNDEAFGDGVNGSSGERFMPASLYDKAAVWRQAYAEQLRAWQMFTEAAELESISGDAPKVRSMQRHKHDGVVISSPQLSHKTVCEICLTCIVGLEQVCPVCLHATHLDCLTSLLGEEPVEGGFCCPSGCGCECMEVPFEVVRVPQAITTPAKAADHVVRKRTSFTDPRRWRARLEGDSW